MTTSATIPRLSAAIVGAVAGPLTHEIDARWLMAYAAALGEEGPRYYDTAAPGGPLAHPIFPVCYEWPLAQAIRARTIGEAIAPLGVHASHHLTIHRPPRAGDRLSTTARVVALSRRRAGALVVVRFETVDDRGRPVTTTLYGSVYRGVHAEAEGGEPLPPIEPATENPDAVRWGSPVQVAAQAAHVYTEGARIWNPIHTDIAAARAAGLPGLILHGTATLGLAVSRVIGRDLGGDPAVVRGVAARFTGMVRLPSTFVVHGRDRLADRVGFDAVDAGGRAVLSEGALWL
jgi:acyl dehydratase